MEPLRPYPHEFDRDIPPAPQVKIVGIEALGRLAGGARDFGEAQSRLDRAGDTARHLVLQIEYVIKRAVEPLGPDVCAGAVSISWPAMRTRSPAFRTEPSST